ncbi:hypothetical protein [Streptomyces sviceus]|uniref:hypothetical protein n=1 Tax=Streptomyces sviceus TaxID=285530 RepID=UPI0033170A76
MANIVWHKKLRMHLDLNLDDLGHEEHPDLWDMVYRMDKMYADRNVPVGERDLLCGGLCQDAGVEAPMYLRLRANGRREAVHERREDEDRHIVPVSDEHKAYQERILRAAQEGGFGGDSEVRTRVGRSWIQTDTLIEGADGRRIGWEVQLSSASVNGPRSVRSRATRAQKNGITPAWHTDRSDYAHRHDTHWTRSNSLPAYVIAKTGDLRVISGFRRLDFWHCNVSAVHPCPHGVGRCGKAHATPTPKDVLFDDLVRQTAAGTIVPIEFRTATKTHRFWVAHTDHERYTDLLSDDTRLPPLQDEDAPSAFSASRNRPTCQPSPTAAATDTSTSNPLTFIPAQSAAPDVEIGTSEPESRPDAAVAEPASGLPATLISLQKAADAEHARLRELTANDERRQQRLRWFEAAAAAQAAVTAFARTKRLNRYEVEQELRRVARRSI